MPSSTIASLKTLSPSTPVFLTIMRMTAAGISAAKKTGTAITSSSANDIGMSPVGNAITFEYTLYMPRANTYSAAFGTKRAVTYIAAPGSHARSHRFFLDLMNSFISVH